MPDVRGMELLDASGHRLYKLCLARASSRVAEKARIFLENVSQCESVLRDVSHELISSRY